MSYIDPKHYDIIVEKAGYDDAEQMLESIGIRCIVSGGYYDDIEDFDEELADQGIFVAKEYIADYNGQGGGSVMELQRQHGSVSRNI